MDAQIIADITFALLLMKIVKIQNGRQNSWCFYHNLCISSADLINILGESFSSC